MVVVTGASSGIGLAVALAMAGAGAATIFNFHSHGEVAQEAAAEVCAKGGRAIAVNHRVQNSIQLIIAFLSLQARDAENPSITSSLQEAQRRLSAVALVHRRLYTDDNVESINLSRYVDDLLIDLKSSMGPEWTSFITTDLAPVMIPADNAVNVGLILVELVINAQKYAYDGGPGPISVVVEQHRARFRLIVADKGKGRSGNRQGFGSRMLSAMVKRLSGTIEDDDNRPGLRVIFSAPIDPNNRLPMPAPQSEDDLAREMD